MKWLLSHPTVAVADRFHALVEGLFSRFHAKCSHLASMDVLVLDSAELSYQCCT